MTGLTDSLPFAHPGVFWRHDGDHSAITKVLKYEVSSFFFCDLPVKVVRSDVHYTILVLLHSQEGFAVVAAIVLELLDGLKNKVLLEVIFKLLRGLTLIREHTKQARRPRRSFGMVSNDILSAVEGNNKRIKNKFTCLCTKDSGKCEDGKGSGKKMTRNLKRR